MEIINFNNVRVVGNNHAISPGLELFDYSQNIESKEDNLFIDKIIIISSGSGYTNPSVLLSMISGSVIVSASAFLTVDSGKLDSLTITNTGIFSHGSIVSGSISDSSGVGGRLYVSLSRMKNTVIHFANSPVYDSFIASKNKIRLILYVKKGEMPRMPNFGTSIYSKILEFDQVNSVDQIIDEISNVLSRDIEDQVPEVEVLNITNNESETNLDENKIGISIVFRHKLLRKTDTMNFNISDSSINESLIRENFINEDGDTRAIRYLK